MGFSPQVGDTDIVPTDGVSASEDQPPCEGCSVFPLSAVGSAVKLVTICSGEEITCVGWGSIENPEAVPWVAMETEGTGDIDDASAEQGCPWTTWYWNGCCVMDKDCCWTEPGIVGG